MQAFQPLLFFSLPIPVWQILAYAAVVSLFLFVNKIRFSLLAPYVFILFLLYYWFRGDLVALTSPDRMVRTVYDLFGFVFLGAGVFAFFFLERGKDFLAGNLKKRNAEIADLKARAKKAEKQANALEAQLQETEHDLHAQAASLKQILDGKIDQLEDRLEERETLLTKRSEELAELARRAEEAERKAHELESQAAESQGSFHTEAAALKEKLERELNEKIAGLEKNLKENAEGLAQRDRELSVFKSKSNEAEKAAQALKAQLEESQKSAAVLKSRLEEVGRDFQSREAALKKSLGDELGSRVGELEKRLVEREALIKKQDAALADFNRRAEESAKSAGDLKLRLEESRKQSETLQAQLDDARRGLQGEAAALEKKMAEMEVRLKEKESLLDKRGGESADYKRRAEAAEKAAQDLKMQVEEANKKVTALKAEAEQWLSRAQAEGGESKKKLEQDLNAKIAQMEERLKEKEGLLEKRGGELADLKGKAEAAEKAAQALKTQVEESQKKGHALKTEIEQHRQALEAQAVAFKKKLEDESNAKIRELENRLKEKDGLAEKQGGEASSFKHKAEEAEKRAQVLKGQAEEAQKTAQALMAQIAETQQSLKTQEAALKKKWEQELHLKIAELENRLKEKDGQLEKNNAEIVELKRRAQEAEKKGTGLKFIEPKPRPGVKAPEANEKNSLEQELKNKTSELKELQEQVNHKDGLLALMAKRNRELADLKSNAEQRIEALETQLKDGRQVFHAGEHGKPQLQS